MICLGIVLTDEAYTPRSDSSDSSTSSSSSSSSSDSSSYMSDAETEDKLTALKKKAATSGVTSAPETNTESELDGGTSIQYTIC